MTRFRNAVGLAAMLPVLAVTALLAGCFAEKPMNTSSLVDTDSRATLVGKWVCEVDRKTREASVPLPLPDVLELYHFTNSNISEGSGRLFIAQDNGTLEGFSFKWWLRDDNAVLWSVSRDFKENGTLQIESSEGRRIEYDYTLSGSTLTITGITDDKGKLVRYHLAKSVTYKKAGR